MVQKIDKSKPKYVAADFGVHLNNILRNELAKDNISVAFKTRNKLGSLLRTPKPRNTKKDEDKTGVYKISCSDCPKYYIGQTSRSFKTRFKEHLPAKTPTQRSAFAAHIINENHSYNNIENNLDILHVCNKGKLMDCLEEFHIYKAVKSEPNNILNEQVSFKSNIIYDTAMSIARKTSRDKEAPNNS